MDSSNLTREQAEELKEQARVRLVWANRLVERCVRLGFPGNDPIYVAAAKVQAALQELHVQANYTACGMGGPGGQDSRPER